MTDFGYFLFFGIPVIMITGFVFYVTLTVLTIIVNSVIARIRT